MIPKYVKVTPLRAENDYLLLFVGANLTCQARLFDSWVMPVENSFVPYSYSSSSSVCVRDRAVAALCSVARLAAISSGCCDSECRNRRGTKNCVLVCSESQLAALLQLGFC